MAGATSATALEATATATARQLRRTARQHVQGIVLLTMVADHQAVATVAGHQAAEAAADRQAVEVVVDHQAAEVEAGLPNDREQIRALTS
jgi:hypothetical protein